MLCHFDCSQHQKFKLLHYGKTEIADQDLLEAVSRMAHRYEAKALGEVTDSQHSVIALLTATMERCHSLA